MVDVLDEVLAALDEEVLVDEEAGKELAGSP